MASRTRLFALACMAVIAPFGCFLDATGEASPSSGGGGSTPATGGGGSTGEGGEGEGGDVTNGGAPTGGSSVQGGGGAGGSPVEGGGGSGPVAECGNGIIEEPEECDDQNIEAADGCLACLVTCGPAEAEHPTTHHCYQLTSDTRNFDGCVDLCDNRPGYYLAALTDQSEFETVATLLLAASWPPHVWVGGYQEGPGDYRWISGDPWGFTPATFTGWKPGEPTDDNGSSEDHIAIWNPSAGTLSWLSDASDYETKRCLCEHSPVAGMPPSP